MKKLFSLMQNEQFMAYAQIVLGSLVGAVAYPMFLTPNHIAPGGLTGLATVINFLFPVLPVGITSLALNLPLFLVGYKTMGRVFVFRSFVATVLFSLLIDLLPLPVATLDPLLGCLFGGVLLGVGLGLILRGGATTGGSDMVARLVHKRFQHITVGAFLFFIDCCVVLLAGMTIQVEYALYAFISIYISSKLIDVVMDGFTREKACYVISEKNEQVKTRIMAELDRGVTLLTARGGYSGAERPVLLCVLSAQEVGRLKAIVRDADEKAFIFISDAHEVLGEGFRNLNRQD